VPDQVQIRLAPLDTNAGIIDPIPGFAKGDKRDFLLREILNAPIMFVNPIEEKTVHLMAVHPALIKTVLAVIRRRVRDQQVKTLMRQLLACAGDNSLWNASLKRLEIEGIMKPTVSAF